MIISISQLVRMKNTAAFLLLLLLLASPAVAQPAPPTNAEQYPYARFSPSMAIIIVVLIVALFFMGFFSIYVRHCSDSSAAAAGSARRALSLRTRRPPASRGLEASVIESFPTFSYSEVRDHQIADKGSSSSSLECAVCLCEFQGVETLRLLPTCDHVFHPECIDAWLASHVTCPVCRANLSPPPPPPLETPLPESSPAQPPTAELVVQVLDDGIRSDPLYSLSPATAPAPARRSWSIRMPKVGVFGKFRSHSTGHSLVQPGENLERFTLRLPERVRKEVMDRALLNRTGSLAAAAALPRQGSSSRASFYKRIERDGRSSDRWSFSTRGMSLKSPRGSTDGGGGEGGKSPVKRPSFKCLEPKAAEDETGLIVHDSESHPV